MGVGTCARYLSTAELAELSGMHVGSIRRALNEGRIPAVKVGGRWLIDGEAIFGRLERSRDAYECVDDDAPL